MQINGKISEDQDLGKTQSLYKMNSGRSFRKYPERKISRQVNSSSSSPPRHVEQQSEPAHVFGTMPVNFVCSRQICVCCDNLTLPEVCYINIGETATAT